MIDKHAVDAIVAAFEAEWAEIAQEKDRLRKERTDHEAAVEELKNATLELEEKADKYEMEPEAFNALIGDLSTREEAVAKREVAVSNSEASALKKLDELDKREAEVTDKEGRLKNIEEALAKREQALDKERSEYRDRIKEEFSRVLGK